MKTGQRNKILIVDDEELNRELLRQIFEDEFEILTAANGQEAIEQFEQNRTGLAAVLLDLIMPKKNGYEVLEFLNERHELQTIPVILITADTEIKTALRCFSLGAAEVINKPFTARIVRQRVMNMIEMYGSREKLRDSLDQTGRKLSERERQLEIFNHNLIDAVGNLVEFRDQESGEHIMRVKGFTRLLAEAYMRLYPDCGLTPGQVDIIVESAALHDIGKIAIPDSILLKPGRLTADEFTIMKSHTTKGCDILDRLRYIQDREHYDVARDIIRHHHEKYDGKGYPDGFRGDEIPLSAQLVSVADVYDALTSERVYKKAYDKETAYGMIQGGQCGIFDPKLMHCLEQTKGEFENFAACEHGEEMTVS